MRRITVVSRTMTGGLCSTGRGGGAIQPTGAGFAAAPLQPAAAMIPQRSTQTAALHASATSLLTTNLLNTEYPG
jgi:hypothetical protein